MTAKAVRLAGDAADDPPGACFITDPQTGQQKCQFIPQSVCASRGGVFVGGLCPPGADALMMAKAAVPGKAKKAAAAKAAAKATSEGKKAGKGKRTAKSIKALKTKKASKVKKPKGTRKTSNAQKKKKTK